MERQPNVLIALSSASAEGDGLSPFVKNKNVEKLLPHGISPTFATNKMSNKEQDKLYEAASGVLIPGGVDVNPAHYGETPHPILMAIDHELDELQLRLIKKTLDDKKPLLGICRGAQILAVACGGKLIQHLPDVTEEKHGISIDLHDDVYPSSIVHDVIIYKHTKAYEIFKTDRLNVPSRHHQAIKHPGTLIISGVSPEGIAEMVEHPSLPFHVGLQTHPELVDTMDSVFAAFAKAVQTYASYSKPAIADAA